MGLPFSRSDGFPVSVQWVGLIVLTLSLGYLALRLPIAERYGIGLSADFAGNYIWIAVFIGVFPLLARKTIWVVDQSGVSREVHSVFGKKIEHYSLAMITKITVNEGQREGRVFYTLTIKLTSGRKLRFEAGYDFGEAWDIKRELEDAIAAAV